MNTRVLVTGATGYVAGHCIAELLAHGYTVRGTVRDTASARSRPHLAEHLRDGRLELVIATLDSDAGWAEAVDGCDYVLHVASPFPSTPPANESELIEPAVQGTLRVLRAAAAGDVRRVVLTSSVAAVAYGHDVDKARTEADWSVVDKVPAYQKSKTLAERAAWEFAESLPTERGFELVAVNPGMILGPVFDTRLSTSHEAVRKLLDGSAPGSVRTGWAPVDVRDLAVAHRLAMEHPDAPGNRYICADDPLWMGDMARILADQYVPQGYSVPTRVVPNWLVRVVAVFDRTVRLTVPVLGRTEFVSADKARRELGWTMRPIAETLADTVDSLIEHGVVRSRRTATAPVGV
ncbi:SDR family oxidoreductase [Nocardia lijiangensis]|uniref:SDR family oxidoreductase n=1 Tax=Nocardia lijiangensis TaxID=299618 RepID=UPI00082A5AE2|nr:aldehyde reductase [Nocardia lijiangensis]